MLWRYRHRCRLQREQAPQAIIFLCRLEVSRADCFCSRPAGNHPRVDDLVYSSWSLGPTTWLVPTGACLCIYPLTGVGVCPSASYLLAPWPQGTAWASVARQAPGLQDGGTEGGGGVGCLTFSAP